MAALKFVKATKKQARLRMALTGPSGSGKTYSSLAIAKHLGARVAVIDTERGSASKYSQEFEFDVLELESFSPAMYVEAILAAEDAGYDVLIIDSLSHAWMGKGGALEQVDKASAKAQGGGRNSFFAWREVTPQHNALVDAMLRSRCHIIATMRAKTDYVIDDVNGKKTPTKIGLAAIQREGMEYEFDVAADLTLKHEFIPSKTRCKQLDGVVIENPGENVASILNAWLTDGEVSEEKPTDEIQRLWLRLGYNDAQLRDWLIKKFNLAKDSSLQGTLDGLSEGQVSQTIDIFRLQLEEKAAGAKAK